MNSRFPCPIIGCPHYRKRSNKQFSTISHLIRHLKSDDHNHSRHLIDHNLCNKINLYRCTHTDCSTNKNVFFQSHRNLTTHYSTAHPLTCLPTFQQHDPPNQLNPFQSLTDIIFDSPDNDHLTNNWNSGAEYILKNYQNEPPHFRATWRRLLSRNNLKLFN